MLANCAQVLSFFLEYLYIYAYLCTCILVFWPIFSKNKRELGIIKFFHLMESRKGPNKQFMCHLYGFV